MSFRSIDDDILGALQGPGPAYFVGVSLALAVLAWGLYAFWYQVQVGLGVAGYQPPILWAVYITNFVFWVGITHSGTLVSAVLFLCRARWRTGIARASEAMTVFALMTAGLFPIIHLGRPWYFYWLFPYPNQRGLWVNFRSPLIWDVFAISSYLTVSALFLYLGLVPDIAAARDRMAPPRPRPATWQRDEDTVERFEEETAVEYERRFGAKVRLAHDLVGLRGVRDRDFETLYRHPANEFQIRVIAKKLDAFATTLNRRR